MQIRILPAWRGRTIESILRQEFSFSRRQIIALKKCNGLILNGVPVYAKTRLRGGENLLVRFPPPPPQKLMPEKIDVEITYEDPDLIVVNKPAGMLVHPVRFHRSGTLANALTYHWQKTGSAAAFHAVHRLDQSTSGLLLIAKNPWSHQQLSLQLQNNSINRLYLAVTAGFLPATHGLITAPIKKGATGIKRYIAPDGQPACTRFRTLKQSEQAALHLVKLITGRTHQIRVHFAHMGAPLWGDALYGHPDPHFSRPALHAVSLSFIHPRHQRRVKFRAPLPPDLKTLTHHLGLIPSEDRVTCTF
ncbi:RluA family pseudouridine synthase [Hydrogenispora sp. UU3]|uniref:Pseudouridine synthase n=1 Tax=Capillibacterium thermochitinicola TaxID=2699427 RepID=A0A8J6HZ72_9FIRM|nr:RluA family pseudouridine synthase [Capillibacterium thermochitinicola]MBA2132358.1 RluA family pseudouridine synthase [Capillibacterium thermochitinicola]